MSNIEAVMADLHAKHIDPMSLVAAALEPHSVSATLLVTPAALNVGNEMADIELLVLLADPRAMPATPPASIAGHTVTYHRASAGIDTTAIAIAGVTIDILRVVKPEKPLASDPLAFRQPFLMRLALGTVLDNEPLVAEWRRHYETHNLRMKWIAQEFTGAAKNLEDVEAAIGGSTGYISHLGTYSATGLVRALTAYENRYCPAIDWPSAVDTLIRTTNPETSALLRKGRDLAFPGLLPAPHEQRTYFEQLYTYCREVTALLSRDEAVANVLASIIHDFDIIV